MARRRAGAAEAFAIAIAKARVAIASELPSLATAAADAASAVSAMSGLLASLQSLASLPTAALALTATATATATAADAATAAAANAGESPASVSAASLSAAVAAATAAAASSETAAAAASAAATGARDRRARLFTAALRLQESAAAAARATAAAADRDRLQSEASAAATEAAAARATAAESAAATAAAATAENEAAAAAARAQAAAAAPAALLQSFVAAATDLVSAARERRRRWRVAGTSRAALKSARAELATAEQLHERCAGAAEVKSAAGRESAHEALAASGAGHWLRARSEAAAAAARAAEAAAAVAEAEKDPNAEGSNAAVIEAMLGVPCGREILGLFRKKPTATASTGAGTGAMCDGENDPARFSNVIVDWDAVAGLERKLADDAAEARARAGKLLDVAAEHERKLAQPEYASSFLDLRRAVAERVALGSAHKDLVRYAHALDGAIMMFHSEKLNEVNKVLAEHWKETYAGTDIETVKIYGEAPDDSAPAASASSSSASASAGAGALGAGLGRKKTHYRVIMVRDGQELEMRGRCSAGQKVLVCLLIRLALAEVFCSKCNVLALDEPTTNLDKANARNLATALSRLLAKRRTQRGFQMILITHDKDFIDRIKADEYCDKLFFVSKNKQTRQSQVRARNVGEAE